MSIGQMGSELFKISCLILMFKIYDMRPLTLVRWLLQRAFKFEQPFGSGSELKRVPPTQKLKKIPA